MSYRIELTEEERCSVDWNCLASGDSVTCLQDGLSEVIESIVAAREAKAAAKALRDAALTPAAMRVNTKDEASCREWLLGWADDIESQEEA